MMGQQKARFDKSGNPLCPECSAVLQQDPENMYELWCPQCNERRATLKLISGNMGAEWTLVSKYEFQITVLGDTVPFAMTCATTQSISQSITEAELDWHRDTMRLFIDGMTVGIEKSGMAFTDPLESVPLNDSVSRTEKMAELMRVFGVSGKLGVAVVVLENYTNRQTGEYTQKVMTVCNMASQSRAQAVANKLANDTEEGMQAIMEKKAADGTFKEYGSFEATIDPQEPPEEVP